MAAGSTPSTPSSSAGTPSFSNVRVHTSPAGASSIGAQAYATGNQVHFPAGGTTPPGQHLLGHELAHVVQQGSSPSSIPAAHTLQTMGMSSKGAAEVAGGSAPSSSVDRAVLRGAGAPL
ncbi:MAG: DUF4157 domain-containing protein [Phycisphaerae bacterium]|nr:DUF4157 domain-containing protein [Phycisphaerae bacterium]